MACKCYHADQNFLGKIGVCWGTKECEPCSCGGDEAKCDFYGYVRERVKKPTTNADRIRSMSDEEMAVFLYDRSDEYYFPMWTGEITDRPNTEQAWLDWLKQEVDT